MSPEDVPDGPLLVDTDVFTWLTWRSGRSRWAEFAALVDGHPIALPFVVIAELRGGAIKAVRRGVWPQKRADRLNEAIALAGNAQANGDVTDHWAELHATLEGQLKGGGVNDMWIAACGLAYGAPIVTGNLSDFTKVQAKFPALQLVHPDL